MRPNPVPDAALAKKLKNYPVGWMEFLQAWHTMYDDRLVAVSTLVRLFEGTDTVTSGPGFASRRGRSVLNQLLWKALGRSFGNLVIEVVGPLEDASHVFRLRELPPLRNQFIRGAADRD